jgi:hypothetical protein
VAGLHACLIVAALTATATAPAQQQPREMRKYANASWRWAIAYPAGWTVEARDPDLVRIGSKGEKALCSIHSGAIDRFNNADEFADFMVLNDGRFFRDKGQKFTVVARRRLTLPNGVAGSDVLVEIGPGGKSRRLYVLVDGRGFAIDCEAYASQWNEVEASYHRLIMSFTVSKR